MRLHATGLRVTFGGVHALDGVDVDVAAGERLAVVGANGAGKSTLLAVLSGLLAPDGGAVSIDGRRLAPHPSAFAAAGVRRSFQHLRLVDRLSVDENIALGLSASLPHLAGVPLSRRRATRTAVQAAREAVGLSDSLGRSAGQLSYGQRKRLELARVLVAAPRVALLDEPLAGVDAADRTALAAAIGALADSGAAVVVVEHDLADLAAVVDRVIVLDDGVVARSGAASELFA